MTPEALQVEVFSTAPQSAFVEPSLYLKKAKEVARWSEAAGCKGILIYTDNRLIDPWLVAQVVVEHTHRLCPLVAVQPVYMHPYSVAKMVSSFAYLYGRQVYLNMVAGGFRTDLLSLCDETPHDSRYERLLEYITIVKNLFENQHTLTFSGKFYKVKDLLLKPHLPPELLPGIFISGSSEAGMAAAKAIGATAVEYPKPGEEYGPCAQPRRQNSGIRIGIITHEDKETAWEIAHQRFPGDHRGQLMHKIAMRISDSQWHKQLSEIECSIEPENSIYWLWPFKNYQTFCPYLVGNYDEVSEELAKYVRAGFKNFILDIPAEEQDLHASGVVFRKAGEIAACQA